MIANKKPRRSGANGLSEAISSHYFVKCRILFFVKYAIQIGNDEASQRTLKGPMTRSFSPNVRVRKLFGDFFCTHLIVSIKAIVFPKVNHGCLRLLKNVCGTRLHNTILPNGFFHFSCFQPTINELAKSTH